MAGSTDSPDWASTITTPAIDLGAFTVPAGTIATVYNGPTPPGCHSLKVFVESTDPTFNAQQVTVIDPANASVLDQFIGVTGTRVIAQVDDVCTPNIRVDVQAAATQQTVGRVVAYLSDQAVWIDNDLNSPIPIIPGKGGFPLITVEPGATSTLAISSAGNTLVSIVYLPTIGAIYHVHAVTASFSGATAGAPSLQITGSVGNCWEAQVAETAAGNPVHHYTFPNGGLIPVNAANTGFSIVLTASGAAGIFGVLSAVVEARSQ